VFVYFDFLYWFFSTYEFWVFPTDTRYRSKIAHYMLILLSFDFLNSYFLLFLLCINPKIPGRIMTVVRKQAPTPMNMANPKETKPRKTEKAIDPKASIVVSEVRRIAFPVLAKTVRILLFPSFRQRCMICTPSSMPMPMIIGRHMTFIIVSIIPVKFISPTIQNTPRARGIIAINA